MNTVRFEFSESNGEIEKYMNDSYNEIDSVDYIVFRMPVCMGYEVYSPDGERFAHYDTFDQMCEEFIGNECKM